jgi:hypothetical protein
MTDEGRVHRVWSNHLHEQLRKQEAQPGEVVSAQFVRAEPVQNAVKVDEKTGADRGEWQVKIERMSENNKSEASPAEIARDRSQERERQEQQRRETHCPKHKQ